MADHVQVAIIGGGVVGCSTLLHLAEAGWRDTLLLEKNVLTAGSTWHAAGNGGAWSGSTLITRFMKHSLALYRQLEREAGQPLGLHQPGSFTVTSNPARLDEFRRQVARGKTLGLEFKICGPREMRERAPLMDTAGLVAGIWDPLHGHFDPSSVTNAMASKARGLGAKIRQGAKVTGLSRENGLWRIEVEGQDPVLAEHVVNAAGQWAPEIARLAGSNLPIVPMLHQYVVTEQMDEVAALASEHPVIRDREGSFYFRQERNSLLVGPYEAKPLPWMTRGIPPEFGQELLPEDMERIEDGMVAAMSRVPLLERAGIARVVHGPIPYTPDERPLIGPHPGLPNMWLNCGTAIGIIQGGGMGRFLAEWMVEGATEWNPMACHPGRFGDYATVEYTTARAIEAYAEHYAEVPFPGLEGRAGRPARTGMIYDQQKADGAVFGVVNGWERPLWFAPEGVEPVDSNSFQRPESFRYVGAEHIACREAVALFDMSIFGKYCVTGPDAARWYERTFTGRVPKEGRSTLALLCNAKGGIMGDFAAARLAEDQLYIVGAGGGEGMHWDMLRSDLGLDVQISRDTTRFGVLHIAGPRARALLGNLVAEDVSNEALPFLAARHLDFGLCKALVIRVSFSGDLGYEIHVPTEFHRALYARVKKAGKAHGLRLAGGRALHSLRLEKGWYLWGHDVNAEVTPYQAGLGWLVSLKKDADFPGRKALEAAQDPDQSLCLLQVEAQDSDCLGGEPLFHKDAYAGQVTSGGYGHFTGQSLAIGWLPAPLTAAGTRLEVELYGARIAAHVLKKPPFDPQDTRLRG
ncbi:hypothetical protein RA19_01340 [Leisingera sp. ANG-M1]|uniref:FAD-dependent oxidoreductase n=1 Tax=Leisingera sp. ANG-M1 TaxID=1577895 RepID=UPI00057CCF29|nr:FAD-dependent oxidoreductase [Leisingera sp. ANG-M1]KIC12552.1 hypothetical protein RA19_01340 [Leisingera sp. ANG-M1]